MLSSMTRHRFAAGDQVTLRPAADILASLDENGALDGLPFMPEMLEWIGKTAGVFRRVEKTCVSGHPLRKFANDDVVVLESGRCDGAAHDGCKHGCRIYWKESWLQPATIGAPATETKVSVEALRAKLKVKADERRYFCQSTQLLHATEPFPTGARLVTARIALRELRNGDISLTRLLRLVWRSYWLKFHRALGSDRRLSGPHEKRTPSETLGLKPGDRVRVKGRDAIAQTLDRRGRNRGMGICAEMLVCCDGAASVDRRIDRIVDEDHGVMRELSDTVTLRDIRGDEKLAEECMCYGQLGDCPRGEIMYWREIWLERKE